MYIHEHPNWTQFYWNIGLVAPLLDEVARDIGRLFGRLESLGFETQQNTLANNITEDLLRSSEIEGVALNTAEVRSSIARHLGLENQDNVNPSRGVDAIVSVMLRAMQHYDHPISKELLCGWQAAFFESHFAGGIPITVGQYRTCEEQIVSGAFGREKVHYVAPAPERVEAEMQRFILWFNSPTADSWIIRSAIAHLWLVSIHPFEDGNGRLSRLVAEICLARADKSSMRFYSIAAAINRDKKNYYRLLEQTQQGHGDITDWIVWYVTTLLQAVQYAQHELDLTLQKSRFWSIHPHVELSDRQRKVLNMVLDGHEGQIMSRTWAHMGKCSSDTATRDLQDLVRKGLLRIVDPEAKRYVYQLVYAD